MDRDFTSRPTPEHRTEDRTERTRTIAPGKVTRTSKLARSRSGAIQRKAPPSPDTRPVPATRTAWDQTMDYWMDMAHRGLSAVQQAGVDQESAATEAQTLPVSGAGESMPAAVQAKMENAFGADFSSVRIHQGSQASALGALAYTQGADVHFAPGQYDPGSQSGQELLGHELAHVVQQAQGRVNATTQAKGVDIAQDAGLEREADEMGARAARGEQASVSGAQVLGEPAAAGVQLSRIGLSSLASSARSSQVIQRRVDKMPGKEELDDLDILIDYAYEDTKVGSSARTFTKVVHDFEKSGPPELAEEVTRLWFQVCLDIDYGSTADYRQKAIDNLERIAAIINSAETSKRFTHKEEIERFLVTHNRETEALAFVSDFDSRHWSTRFDHARLEANFVCWKLLKRGKTREEAEWAVLDIGREDPDKADRWIEMARKMGGEGFYDFVTAHKDNLGLVHSFLISNETGAVPKATIEWVSAYDGWLSRHGKKEQVATSHDLVEVGEGGGIPNTGSDCFMNSVIQMLTQMDYTGMNLPDRLVQVVGKVAHGQQIAANEVRALRTYLARIGLVERATDNHEDASELLVKLLDLGGGGSLEVTTHRDIDHSDSLQDTGQQRGPVPQDAIAYDQGGHVATQDRQTMLEVPVSQAESLIQWLDMAQTGGFTETFEPPPHGFDSYEWAAVNGEWRSVRQRTTRMVFTRLPDPLCIHLLRFDNAGRKVDKIFGMPETFTLTEQGNANLVQKTYRLVAFTYHQGNLGGGHYWTHRRDDQDAFNEYNDSEVSPSTPQNDGIEHSANHDLDHGYIYIYQKSAEQQVLALQDPTGTDLYDRSQYKSVDEVEVEDHESEDSSSSTSEEERQQLWYGVGSGRANRKDRSKDSDTKPGDGLFNEGPCGPICADLVTCMEKTGYAKHCMLGVVEGFSGTYYVTMSGTPSPEFKDAVSRLRKMHSGLNIEMVLVGKIAAISKPDSDSDQGEIDEGSIRTFAGTGKKGNKLGNFPSGKKGEETAKGMPGTCALPKMLHHIIGLGDAPRHASEKWYALDNKKDNRTGTVAVKVADTDQGPTKHHHGQSVPSCKTCRGIVPVQLQGVTSHIQKLEKDLENKTRQVRAQSKRRQQKIEQYVQLVLTRVDIFHAGPKEINEELVGRDDYAGLRKWYLTAIQILVEEAIDRIEHEAAELEPREDALEGTLTEPENKLTRKERKKLAAKASGAKKREGKKGSKQKPVEEVEEESELVQSPPSFEAIIEQLAGVQSGYKALPRDVFSQPEHGSMETPAPVEGRLLFTTGKQIEKESEIGSLDLTTVEQAIKAMEVIMDGLKGLDLSSESE